jgi:hypothetical protein
MYRSFSMPFVARTKINRNCALTRRIKACWLTVHIFVPNCLLQRGVFLFRIVFYSAEYFCSELSFTFLFRIVFYSAEYVCGGSYTAAPGGITSPFYPDSYGSSQTCIYDIGCVHVYFLKKSSSFFCNLLCLLQHTRCKGKTAAIVIWRGEVSAFDTCLKLLNQ